MNAVPYRSTTPSRLIPIAIPVNPKIIVDDVPLEELERRFRDGHPETVAKVASTLNFADGFISGGLKGGFKMIPGREPRGIHSCACPIHPLVVRFGVGFSWDLKDPWRLTCPLCKEEGRAYTFYPNPRYPDDGDGCRPSEEVWREDHGSDWSWEGVVEGRFGPADAFYFQGLCAANLWFALCGDVLPKLGAATHYARRLEADAVGKAGDFAQQAKRLMVTLSRAVFGDSYLSAILDVSHETFRDRLASFYGGLGRVRRIRRFAGYRLSTIDDCIDGEPGRSLEESRYRASANRFPGLLKDRIASARGLASAYCMIAGSFTEAESEGGMRDIAERLVTSSEGDAEQLGKGRRTLVLKRGILDYALDSSPLIGGPEHPDDSTLDLQVDLGILLNNEKLIEHVAEQVVAGLRNSLTGDGLGMEGSPFQTISSLSCLYSAARLQGLSGNFKRGAFYVEDETGNLDLFGPPLIRETLSKFLRCAFPDGRLIPWGETPIGTEVPVSYFDLIDRYDGGLPAACSERFRVGARGQLELIRPLVTPTCLLHEARKALLRSGEGEAHRLVSLDYLGGGGDHHPVLNLTVYAKGHELVTDPGSPGSAGSMNRDWMGTPPAHNTLVLRRETGEGVSDRLKGDLRGFFKDLPGIKAADVAVLDPVELDDAAGEGGSYGRTVAMVEVDEKESYILDIFRARGGGVQDLFFHGGGRSFEVKGVDLIPHADPTEDLYTYSGFSFACSEVWGEKNVKNLQVGAPSGPWTATWGVVPEWSSRLDPLEVDSQVFLKWHFMDQGGSEMIAGSAPGERWDDNRDEGERMKLVCVRRVKTDVLQNYVSVIEPFRKRPFIRRVERLRVRPEQDSAVALKVVLADRTDYILSVRQEEEPVTFRVEEGGHDISSDGELAVASFGPERLESLTVIAGTHAVSDGISVLPTRTRKGKLIDFDDLEKTLIVETAEPLPTDGSLRGEVIQVVHQASRSSFTIDGLRLAGEDRYEIALADSPHLVVNYLRVIEVVTEGVWVETPPVLPNQAKDLLIYKVLRDGSLSYLDHWRGAVSEDVHDEWGCFVRKRHRIDLKVAESVTPGDEIGLSLLDPGRDRFLLTGSGFLKIED